MMDPRRKYLVLSVVLCVVRACSGMQDVFFDLITSLYEITSSENEQLVKDTKVFKEEYDFIVIGAGSGGCAVTNRLTEVPGWDVLLLEAGRDEMFITDVPLTGTILGQTSYNWGYKAEKQRNACLGMNQGRCNWPRGKAMGGTSVINLMVHTRGNRLDYDRWGVENPGWSFQEILPYFIKSEKVVGIRLKDIDPEYHGREGYLNVEYARYNTPLLGRFLKAAEEFGYGVRDTNGRQQLGFSRIQANLRDGRRCSASKAYIRPVRKRPNLFVAKESRVTKILIDPATKRVFGVEFVKDRIRRRIRARKEVILAAGSINTPQLLMLSGVGPVEHLQELGINVIEDLRVGFNLQDHISFNGLAFLVNESVTISDKRVENIHDIFNYMVNHKGPYTMPGGAEGVAFMKSNTSHNTHEDYPDIEIVIGAGALNGDRRGSIRKLLGIPDSFYDQFYRNIKEENAFSMVPVLMHSGSRGRIMLKSKNPFHWPLMYANYFEDENDMKLLIEGIRMAIAIGESNAFKIFNTTLHKEPYPGCEHLSWGSDEYWECCARRYSNSLFHQSGTCRMGPKEDPTAVVDHRLRVHGISGLRVVDASIMPHLPAGHPNAVVFMIGEKAADMIKEDWLGTSFGF